MEVTATVSNDQMSYSCPSCKTPYFRGVARDAMFDVACSSCGVSFSVRNPGVAQATTPAVSADDARFCTRCGSRMTPASAFCPSCGASVSGASGAASNQLASKIGQHITSSSADAFAAVRRIVIDPVGGLQPAYETLGAARAQAAGIALCVIFALFTATGAMAGMKNWIGAFVSFGDGAAAFFKIALGALVLCALMVVVMFIIRRAVHAEPPIAADIFTIGAAVTLLGVITLINGVLGITNGYVIAVTVTFAWIYLLLMMFAGMTRAGALAEKIGAPAVPAVLLVTAWLTKFIMSALS